MAKRAITETPEDRQPPVEYAWSTEKSFSHRLLLIRNEVRTLPLWKHFETAGGEYDAFSIHQLAREIEQVLNAQGIISEFHQVRWNRNGNLTIVEGHLRLECIDTGEVRNYATFGEAVDNQDKGINKAVSAARKLGLVCALQLTIGKDIEADAQAAATKQPQSSGEASPPAPEDAAENENYWTFNFLSDNDSQIRESLVLQQVTGFILSIRNVPGVDAFIQQNLAALRQYQELYPDKALKIKEIADAHKATLNEHLERARAA